MQGHEPKLIRCLQGWGVFAVHCLIYPNYPTRIYAGLLLAESGKVSGEVLEMIDRDTKERYKIQLPILTTPVATLPDKDQFVELQIYVEEDSDSTNSTLEIPCSV